MKYVNFIPYTGHTFWADQIFQKARSNNMRQPLYDYLMSHDEKDRGNLFTNLYFLQFREVPTDTPTYWADWAYQLSQNSRQFVYDSIMNAAPENRANEFTLWASLGFDAKKYQPDTYA